MERTIVIIGGSRGIGAACVERILKHGLKNQLINFLTIVYLQHFYVFFAQIRTPIWTILQQSLKIIIISFGILLISLFLKNSWKKIH